MGLGRMMRIADQPAYSIPSRDGLIHERAGLARQGYSRCSCIHLLKVLQKLKQVARDADKVPHRNHNSICPGCICRGGYMACRGAAQES